MKRGLLILLFLSLLLPAVSGLNECDLDVSLVSQDPYPAIPGDYVKLVFQIDGLEKEDCGDISFELLEKFPIDFDPGDVSKLAISSGFYERTYDSFFIAPYRVRVSEEALDGENPIEAVLNYKQGSILYEFNLTVEDARADFEIFVRDFDASTNIMSFEVLNVGEDDIEALTIEIPKQEGVVVKGSNIVILGDLDSNEDTTAEFEALSEGGDILLNIKYTDTINVRREIQKTVNYDPSYFQGRKADEPQSKTGMYAVLVVILLIVVWIIIRKVKKKKRKRGER